ncbi:ATP-dependent sacrificial sulfur transferase LarE [Streptomyces sp. NPDC005393]|uniref:ATP-dependent sacrificial sulfur transferase LarE n=1 Tax=Streptomyces sp. NPDC005393 TaxID=3157041 RepID=UPI0033B493C8
MAEELLRALRERIREETALIVAFSGGVDSALVATVASQELGPRAVAVTAVSPSLSPTARTQAREFAGRYGIRHVEVCTDEIERPEYVRNQGDRCYHCKSALLDAVEPIASLAGGRIALGTNTDDLGDHRPGQRAAAARGVISPLVDVGMSKGDVRRVSADLGLSTAAKPASACLASRVAYGDPVTAEVLERIDRAESVLQSLGFAECRVRAHANGTVARIEVPEEDIERVVVARDLLDRELRATGFAFAAIDLAGFRSGRMNVLLGMPGRPPTRPAG